MDISPKRIGTDVGYIVLGAFGTLVIFLLVGPTDDAFGPIIFDLFYFHTGPILARSAAMMILSIVYGLLGITVTALMAEYILNRGEDTVPVLKGLGCVSILSLLIIFIQYLWQWDSFIFIVLQLSIFLGIPMIFRYQYRVWPHGLPLVLGSIPVIILIIFLFGFTVGGSVYVLVAEELPTAPDNKSSVADFDNAHRIERELFSPENCLEPKNSSEVVPRLESDKTPTKTLTPMSEPGLPVGLFQTRNNRRLCAIYYPSDSEYSASVAKFMSQYNAKCPSGWDFPANDTFVARHQDSYYRIDCTLIGE